MSTPTTFLMLLDVIMPLPSRRHWRDLLMSGTSISSKRHGSLQAHSSANGCGEGSETQCCQCVAFSRGESVGDEGLAQASGGYLRKTWRNRGQNEARSGPGTTDYLPETPHSVESKGHNHDSGLSTSTLRLNFAANIISNAASFDRTAAILSRGVGMGSRRRGHGETKG